MTYICEKCGSEDIRRDAFAVWDSTLNEWVLAHVFDLYTCMECAHSSKTCKEVSI